MSSEKCGQGGILRCSPKDLGSVLDMNWSSIEVDTWEKVTTENKGVTTIYDI